MTECNGNNKNSSVYLNSRLFFIIVEILIFFICGFMLFVAINGYIYMYIPHNCFVGLGIGIALSYVVKKNRCTNKKLLFMLTLLCLFFVYLFFNLAIYILPALLSSFPSKVGFLNFVSFLWYRALDNPLDFHLPGDSSIPSMDFIMYKFTDGILWFYNTITLSKIDSWNLARIINIQVWIIEFFISFFCAWQYIVFTCPWLFPKSFLNRFLPKRPQNRHHL